MVMAFLSPREERGKQLCIAPEQSLVGIWRLDGTLSINPTSGPEGSKHIQLLFLDGQTVARGKLGFPKKLN